jgi:endonuclease YncB( thermonuclease family)
MKTMVRIYRSEAEADRATDRAKEAGWSIEPTSIEPDGVHVTFYRAEGTPARRAAWPRWILYAAFGGIAAFCLGLAAVGISAITHAGQPIPFAATGTSMPPKPTPTLPPTVPSATGYQPTQPLPAATVPDTQLAPTPTAETGPTPFPEGWVRAHVTRIVDGDTIYVAINGLTDKVRYIGIDTPERGTAFYDVTTEANRALVDDQDVLLEPDVEPRDQYKRLLFYVYLTSGVFVNGELVAQGMADAIAYPPNTKHQAELDALEDQAKAQGLGMWAQNAPSAVILDDTCSQFNSPGDDNYSKEQEYICITNQGTAVVDMTGWWVRDKAGATFTVPAFSLAASASVRVRTGCGQNSATDLYWCKDGSAVWNNSGDTAYLYNAQAALVDELTY